MAIKNRAEYLEALRKMSLNIHKFGELIEDVTTHPTTKRTVESHALNYDAAIPERCGCAGRLRLYQ